MCSLKFDYLSASQTKQICLYPSYVCKVQKFIFIMSRNAPPRQTSVQISAFLSWYIYILCVLQIIAFLPWYRYIMCITN